MKYKESINSDDSDDRTTKFYHKEMLVEIDDDKDIDPAYSMIDGEIPFGYDIPPSRASALIAGDMGPAGAFKLRMGTGRARGSPGWGDAGQVRPMLKVQMVYSNMKYKESINSDDSDDREDAERLYS